MSKSSDRKRKRQARILSQLVATQPAYFTHALNQVQVKEDHDGIQDRNEEKSVEEVQPRVLRSRILGGRTVRVRTQGGQEASRNS